MPAHIDISSIDKKVTNSMIADSFIHEFVGGAQSLHSATEKHKPFSAADLLYIKTVPAPALATGHDVFIYVDPSFQTSSFSGTALAVVTRHGRQTVVLGAEHYFPPDSECGNWVNTVSKLTVGIIRFLLMLYAPHTFTNIRVVAESNLSADAVNRLCREIKSIVKQHTLNVRVLYYHRGKGDSFQTGFFLDYSIKNEIFRYFVEEVKARNVALADRLISCTVADLDVRHYIVQQLGLLQCDRTKTKGVSYTGKADKNSDDLLVSLACATYLAKHRSGQGEAWRWE
jgi:hypothetical protein